MTLAAAPVLEKYKIPMVTGSAESPLIWREKFKFTFGTIPPVNFTGSSALNVIATLDPPPKRAVVIGSNDAFSKATAETFRDTCEKLKIKVMKYDIVPSGQDLTPYMSAVRAMRPDVIAFGGHDEELIRLVKALRQIHYAPKALLMHYGVTEPAFIEALGKDAEQVYGASVWTPTLKTKGGLIWPDAQSYAADIKAAFGIVPDYTMPPARPPVWPSRPPSCSWARRPLWMRPRSWPWWMCWKIGHSYLLRPDQVLPRRGVLSCQHRSDPAGPSDPGWQDRYHRSGRLPGGTGAVPHESVGIK